MRRFKKKPELSFVVIPGLGRISDDRVLEGDQYAKFAPSILVEVLPAPAAPLKEPAPAVLIPPPPPPVTAPAPVPTRATMNEAFPTKEELEAAVEKENKQTEEQIEKAVERLAPVEEEKKPEPKKEEKKPAPKPTSGKKPSGRK